MKTKAQKSRVSTISAFALMMMLTLGTTGKAHIPAQCVPLAEGFSEALDRSSRTLQAESFFLRDTLKVSGLAPDELQDYLDT